MTEQRRYEVHRQPQGWHSLHLITGDTDTLVCMLAPGDVRLLWQATYQAGPAEPVED
jgi:hypothetical protein